MITEMRFLLFAIFFFAVRGDYVQNKECITMKEKPNSCIYFVLGDLNYEHSSQYCYNNLNGALAHVQSYDEVKAIIQRYHWWIDSEWGIPRFRLGMFKKNKYVTHRSEMSTTDLLPKMFDYDIWNASFPPVIDDVSLDPMLYDNNFTKEDYSFGGEKRQYLAITPKNQKWSNVNREREMPFICEVPRFPKLYCEQDWYLHMESRSCFYLNNIAQNFVESAEACREKGSNLASINDKNENEFALKVIYLNTDLAKVWFGLRHDGIKDSKPTSLSNEDFLNYFFEHYAYNVNAKVPSNYSYFADNQPDGIPQGTYCTIYESNTRLWYTYDCSKKAWSLCRKMASPQPYIF